MNWQSLFVPDQRPLPRFRSNQRSGFRSVLPAHFSVSAEFIIDAPNTQLESAERIKDELYEFLASAQEELVLVTAYFIPDETLLGVLEDARNRGVRIVVITNSVQSNNHMLAHVAYRPSRKRILRAGVELFELRPDASIRTKQSVGSTIPGFLGLHSKAAVVDGRHSMVATANLDPRSLDLNMESAMFVEDIELATELRSLILGSITTDNAWRLRLDSRGQLEWVNDRETRTNEPVRGPLQRIMQFLFSLLPLRDQA